MSKNTVKDVSPEKALELAKKGALFIDVREPHEVARKAFDIPDVLELPMSKFGRRYQEIPTDKKVIIACDAGNRSVMAARMLMHHGYTNIVNMQHGMINWERSGLPVKGKVKENGGNGGGFGSLLDIFRRRG